MIKLRLTRRIVLPTSLQPALVGLGRSVNAVVFYLLKHGLLSLSILFYHSRRSLTGSSNDTTNLCPEIGDLAHPAFFLVASTTSAPSPRHRPPNRYSQTECLPQSDPPPARLHFGFVFSNFKKAPLARTKLSLLRHLLRKNSRATATAGHPAPATSHQPLTTSHQPPKIWHIRVSRFSPEPGGTDLGSECTNSSFTR